MGRMDGWVSYTKRFYNWRGGLTQADGGVTSLIMEDPVSIIVVRQDPVTHLKTVLAAQTVRITLDSRLLPSERIGTGVSSAYVSKQKMVVLGWKNDPLQVDTDLQFGDFFEFAGQQFVVKKIESSITDRLLAQAESEG